MVEIVAFSGSLSDSCEHGVTTISFGDVVDKFLDKHGLADTSTSEKT
jgi:hypothetical protein